MSYDPDWVYNSDLDAFTLYHQLSESERKSKQIGPVLPALGHAVSGAIGSAVSRLLIYPLDLVITRLQVQQQSSSSTEDSKGREAEYSGILDAFQKIYKEEGGIAAFYNGVLHDTAKSVADAFLFFLAYNYVRNTRLRQRGDPKRLPAIDELAVGMIAGAFSKFFTTPIQNVVTRKQTAKAGERGLSTAEIAQRIRGQKGLAGFWSGYSASLVLTLNPSLTMLFHESLLRLLVKREMRSDPGARVTFLLAAGSKALASTITYPFSLAKTRAQVGSEDPVDTSAGGDVDLKDESLQQAEKKLQKKAKRNTVFATIARIAQREGVGALYSGVQGEVLKGFLTHGFTMVVKERIHGAVVQLYFLILKALKRYPGPEELARQAKEGAQNAADSAREGVQTAAMETRSFAQDAVEKGRESVRAGGEAVEQGIRSGNEALGNATEKAKSIAENSLEVGKSVVGRAEEKVQEVFSMGKESAEKLPGVDGSKPVINPSAGGLKE